MTVIITLTVAGSDSGPFNLYSNIDGFTSAFETGVSKASLLAGYSSALVPDYTTTLRVMSIGECTNFIDINLTSLTTTTTTTIAPTTTTTTSFLGTGMVFITNLDVQGTINDVQVNSTSIIVTQGDFPVEGGENVEGSYGGASSGLSTVSVFVSIATGTTVELGLSTGYYQCIGTTGTAVFTNIDLSTNANIFITMGQDGDTCP